MATTSTKTEMQFIAALFLSLWALTTGIIWVYWAALYLSYPAAITAFLLWLNLKKKDNRSYFKSIPIILGITMLLSFGTLVYALMQG